MEQRNENKTELKMIKMSDVQSQTVDWLWYPYIPYGKLTIIQGDPGDGKTTLILNIAARLSKGEGLDNDMKVTEPVNIIYQTAEDGLADTVKPRLELAEAVCERIMVIDETEKSLSMIDERLETAIKRTDNCFCSCNGVIAGFHIKKNSTCSLSFFIFQKLHSGSKFYYRNAYL